MFMSTLDTFGVGPFQRKSDVSVTLDSDAYGQTLKPAVLDHVAALSEGRRILISAVRDRRYSRAIESLIAVIVRAAVVPIPRIVRIIIRHIVGVIFCLWRVAPVAGGIISIGAVAE